MDRTASTEPQCLYKGALYLTRDDLHTLMTTSVANVGNTVIVPVIAVVLVTTVLYRRYL